jgi:hypothetical protein
MNITFTELVLFLKEHILSYNPSLDEEYINVKHITKDLATKIQPIIKKYLKNKDKKN